MGTELSDEDEACVEVDFDVDYWDYWDLVFDAFDYISWLIFLLDGPDSEPIFPFSELWWDFSCLFKDYWFGEFLLDSCFSDVFELSYFLLVD